MPDHAIPESIESIRSVPANPPKTLMLMLMRAFGANAFVETGTHHGKTTEWAAGYFDQVISIEGEREYHQRTAARLSHLGNVSCRLGDSAGLLPQAIADLDGPAVIWLDAHWMGDATTYSSNECPVLDEIVSVLAAPSDVHIFIDDARLFLTPPPEPLNIESWPSIDKIVEALGAPDRYTVVFYDTIVSVPLTATTLTADYCQRVATLALEADARRKRRLTTRLSKLARRAIAIAARLRSS